MDRPKIAIVDANTLATLGLKQILQNVMPIMTVDTFGSFAELQSNNPDDYFHYFAAMSIVLENKDFFLERRRKTFVLTLSLDTMSQLSEFHCLCVNVPEQQLVRSLLALQQHGHGGGRNMPPSILHGCPLFIIMVGFLNTPIWMTIEFMDESWMWLKSNLQPVLV